MLNSEIRKYYWQDFSLQRTIAMPAVLLTVTLIILLGIDNEQSMVDTITKYAFAAYFILVCLWGGYRAASSVIEEVNERTWDSQRLSPVSPLNITFGKLIGSTLYTWYGGGIALFIYTLYSLYYTEPSTVAFDVALFALSGVFCHAVSLLVSLESIRTRTYHRRMHAFTFLIIGLIIANIFFSLGNIPSAKAVTWFNMEFNYHYFLLGSLIIFLTWSIIGIYRQMREELKFRNIPWVWGLFVIFLMAYSAGFYFESHVADIHYSIQSSIHLWLGIAFIIGIISTYLMFFVENINITRYRVLCDNIKKHNWIKMGESTPRWIVSSLLMIIAGILLSCITKQTEYTNTINIGLFVVTTWLFILRDGCLLHYFKFSQNPNRATSATIFYLAVLYLLIPSLLYAANAKEAASYFYPIIGTKGILDNLIVVLLQVFIASFLLYFRWRKLSRVIE